MNLLETYKETRQKITALHSEMLENVDGDYIFELAHTLGIVENRQLVFESQHERDAMLDFIIYGRIGDNSILENYVQHHANESEEDQNLLNTMKASNVSLYQITEVDQEQKTIMLTDIYNPSSVYKLVDMAFSETVSTDLLLCTRLLHMDSFSMTSGMNFLFRADHREYLLRRSRKMMNKMRGNALSDKRFRAFFTLNRKDGLAIGMDDVEE